MAILPAGGKIDTRVVFRYFLDRKEVIDALGAMKAKALKKGGYALMQIARRRIKKQGMAKPELRVQKENPGMTLEQLVKSSSISERTRKAAIKRIQEIKNKNHSKPGESPYTHTGMFRDHIVFHWDSTSESVVVGQEMPKGGAWLASLHEFGGTQQVKGYVFVPRYPGPYRAPIMTFQRADSKIDTSKWQPTSMTESRRYDARPYMRPAFRQAIDSGRIAEEFRNKFRVGGL